MMVESEIWANDTNTEPQFLNTLIANNYSNCTDTVVKHSETVKY